MGIADLLLKNMDIELSEIEKLVTPKDLINDEKVYCELIVYNFYKI
jgi:hypothetical protein